MSEAIFVDPSVDAAVIQVAGICYSRVGDSNEPVSVSVDDIDAFYDDCGECYYRQARQCDDGSFADVWMTLADASTVAGAFTIVGGDGTCYYFDFTDPTATDPGSIYAANAVLVLPDCTSCQTPWDGTCGDTATSHIANVGQITGFGMACPLPSPFFDNTQASTLLLTGTSCNWSIPGEYGPCLAGFIFSQAVLQPVPLGSGSFYWVFTITWYSPPGVSTWVGGNDPSSAAGVYRYVKSMSSDGGQQPNITIT